MRMLKLPDNRIRVLVQGVARARVLEFADGKEFTQATIEKIPEPVTEGNLEQEALMRAVKKSLERSVSLGKTISSEVMVVASNLESPGRLADLALMGRREELESLANQGGLRSIERGVKS